MLRVTLLVFPRLASTSMEQARVAMEVVHMGVVAMLSESTGDLFNRSCFNFPTLSDLYKIATYDAMVKVALTT
jgi:hypothetical protein